jgi:murein L,D-transpeptidase YcbB/YkuD
MSRLMNAVRVRAGGFAAKLLGIWLLSVICASAVSATVPGQGVTGDIQALIKSARHPRLRWGDFSDVRGALVQLYAQQAGAPVWLKEGRPTPQAVAMIESLAGAEDRGLHAADYDVDLLKHWSSTLGQHGVNSVEVAAFDVALSVAVMRYVSNLYLGRINPRSVGFGLNIELKRLDLPKRVREIALSLQPEALVAEMEPHFPIYGPLKDALIRYRALAREVPFLRFGFPAKFSPGMSHRDVPALRKMLVALGDLSEVTPGSEHSEIYDQALARAVKAFQLRHGLADDGVIGKGTLSRLSTPIAERLKQIQLGLERLRWLPADVRGLYLIVNIPSFKLYGSRIGDGLGQFDIQMNVVVGEAIDGRSTPVFHADMTTVNFRPYWNVPDAIAIKELVPEILKDPAYLQKNNMEIVASFASTAVPLAADPATIAKLSNGTLKLRQKPGLKNALGLVKFSFPNNNNVYLHSTPSINLFNRARRDFSHGCIRVQDPVALAEWVLTDNGDWPRERVVEAMEKGESSLRVGLKKPIPVYIFYSTVMADPDGRVSFYEDIYGHDRTLQVLLARGFPYP